MKLSTLTLASLFVSLLPLTAALFCEEQEKNLEDCATKNCASFLESSNIVTDDESAASVFEDYDTSSLTATCESISEQLNSDICTENECPACLSEQIEYAECSGPPLAELLISLSDVTGLFGGNETALASTEEEDTCEIKVTECSAAFLSFAGSMSFAFVAAIAAALAL